jgi:hypothetical protein
MYNIAEYLLLCFGERRTGLKGGFLKRFASHQSRFPSPWSDVFTHADSAINHYGLSRTFQNLCHIRYSHWHGLRFCTELEMHIAFKYMLLILQFFLLTIFQA